MNAKDPAKNADGKAGWPLLAALLGAALLAGAMALYLLGPADRGAGESPPGGGERLPAPSLGREDAPVVMVEYADFQCPYCGEYAREVQPKLVEKYVESGTLRIEWRDFPYLGQESVNAALAARAAQAQGRFWEYHDLLYENQKPVNSGGFSDANLIKFAKKAGLDVERFEEDLKSGRYEAAVARDFREGQRRGVAGTPTFVINGKVVVGAQPQEVFEKAIEKAEREAQGG
ncbi:DSBA oxidoreductase [Rubrobacter xylanophilus DSM 9941]|uniref:DSBA oxidoreductase n=1 Tax=Rubrobacter xylanophilus (strain DSM 9941 / JCM 11954 / NBRC 16129 / PRD-1) TaxID=266117 RepID=Q1AUZ8_RUBXD|nr:thioredoxin domain-containing protein [Rubrobacter xylanophilus]ABG04780.1 DSBA oxidoreductase [Rubrobacter xylanophilus DSM 9941]